MSFLEYRELALPDFKFNHWCVEAVSNRVPVNKENMLKIFVSFRLILTKKRNWFMNRTVVTIYKNLLVSVLSCSALNTES